MNMLMCLENMGLGKGLMRASAGLPLPGCMLQINVAILGIMADVMMFHDGRKKRRLSCSYGYGIIFLGTQCDFGAQ